MQGKSVEISSPDGWLRAGISPKGGELISLRRHCHGSSIESVYRSKTGWKGGAPWLFPAVGRNFIGTRPAWRYRGRVYPMPIHGFLKDGVWSLESQTRHSATLVFWSDVRSRRYFPFDFAAIGQYECEARALRARLTVFASRSNSGPMPFSVGNHLTLRTRKPDHCLVRIPARRELLLNPRGLLSGAWRPAAFRQPSSIWNASGTVDRVFETRSDSSWAELLDEHGTVRVEQRVLATAGPAGQARPQDAYFVFYGDRKAGFLCLEPWLGRPNSLNGGDTMRLQPGARFDWEITIRFMLSSGACRAS